jgi:type I restriction enzyme, S subunit
MEVKFGYKQAEVGVIPEDWSVATIGSLAETSSGTTPARALTGRYYLNGTIAWLKTLDLNNAEIFSTDECVTPKAIAETALQLYPAGTVAVAMYGGFNQIGRSGLLRIPATVNQALTAIRPIAELLDSGYLLRTLNHRVGYWRNVASSSRKDPNITGKDVRKFPVPVPSTLNEQRAIATALSDVDGLLGGLDRLIAKKRDLKQAAMQQLLTGQTRLPGFHGEWATKRLGDLFNFSGGFSASRDQLSKEGHCYLHYGDIHGSSKICIDTKSDFQDIPKLDISLKHVSFASMLQDGDVVFVDASEDDAGTSKHVVIMNKCKRPFISGLHTIVAKSKNDELVHEYRRYCFQTSAIREQFLFYSVGTKVSGISKSNIPKLTISFPCVLEQTAIAEVLVEMDADLAALELRRGKSRALKQAMMQELLTGRTRLV